jgi:hypothetical protein
MQKITLQSLPKQKTQKTFWTSPWEDFKALRNGGGPKKMKILRNPLKFVVAQFYPTSRILN